MWTEEVGASQASVHAASNLPNMQSKYFGPGESKGL